MQECDFIIIFQYRLMTFCVFLYCLRFGHWLQWAHFHQSHLFFFLFSVFLWVQRDGVCTVDRFEYTQLTDTFSPTDTYVSWSQSELPLNFCMNSYRTGHYNVKRTMSKGWTFFNLLDYKPCDTVALLWYIKRQGWKGLFAVRNFMIWLNYTTRQQVLKLKW